MYGGDPEEPATSAEAEERHGGDRGGGGAAKVLTFAL